MKAYIVVDGVTEVRLISCLLPQDLLRQTAVVPAGERSNLISVARTLLVTRRKPLAVVVDADTIDEILVQGLRREKEDLLRAVSAGVPFRVFMMVPEIEALLFGVPGAIERVTGQHLSADNMVMARYQPIQVIQQLGKDKGVFSEQIVNGLTAEELNLIRETSPIKELIEFLSEELVPKRQPQTA